MLKVVDFETSKKVSVKITAVRSPAGIDPGYFDVAEIAIAALYQAFPFHKDFGENHWRVKSGEYFKSIVYLWGLEFANNKMCSKYSVTEAVKLMVEKNVAPTLGNMIAAYWKKEDKLSIAKHIEYIKFLEARLHYAYTFDQFNKIQNKA